MPLPKTPSPNAYRKSLLKGLYQKALKGDGTDLEVSVPASDEAEAKTFHLHYNIVAESSKYFATFPTPKSRTISEVDSDSLSLCMQFVYLGDLNDAECAHKLTHDNVAAVLHCADILQIDTLTNLCIMYLQHNLDHSNYEQVVAIADRLNHTELKKYAGYFQTEHSGRDGLVAKRKTLNNQIMNIDGKMNEAQTHLAYLQSQLRRFEEQLEEWFAKEYKRIMSSEWETECGDQEKKPTPRSFYHSNHHPSSSFQFVPSAPTIMAKVYRQSLLKGLYQKALKGDGTDLEVSVPASDEAEAKTFHLHYNIVAESSKYFAAFSTPKSRTISEVDSDSLSLCMQFMYLGDLNDAECAHKLTHDNVAAVLHCADILQIDTLTNLCIKYLGRNLDHSNYEQVMAIADRFNNRELKKSARLFEPKTLLEIP
jgi:hypothetical protein